MITTTKLDLRELIRDVAQRAECTGYQNVARAVLDEIPDELLRDALEQAMLTMVRGVLSLDRMRIVEHGHRDEDTVTSQTGTGDQASSEDHSSGVSGATPRSTRASRIRDWWREYLDSQMKFGPGTEDQKPFRQFTWDEVDFAAAVREEHANGHWEWANRYRRLATAGRHSGVTTVGELPDTVLEEVLTS